MPAQQIKTHALGLTRLILLPLLKRLAKKSSAQWDDHLVAGLEWLIATLEAGQTAPMPQRLIKQAVVEASLRGFGK